MEVFADQDFIMTNEQYNSGIKVEEYNGTYSLVAAWMGKDGDVALKWGYIEKDKKPGKKLPIKVELGDRDQAIEVLQAALRLMNAEPDGPMKLPKHQDYGQPEKPGSYPIEGGEPEYDSIPF